MTKWILITNNIINITPNLSLGVKGLSYVILVMFILIAIFIIISLFQINKK